MDEPVDLRKELEDLQRTNVELLRSIDELVALKDVLRRILAAPDEDAVTLTVRTARPARFALRMRVPWWATGANAVALNGREGGEIAGQGCGGERPARRRRRHGREQAGGQAVEPHRPAGEIGGQAASAALEHGQIGL